MLRIKLIVTGDMEKAALRESLKRVFGDRRRDGSRVEWLLPRKTHGTTTCRLAEGASPSSALKDLAKIMLRELQGGQDGKPADLVVAIDDLELGNFAREHIVVQHFRTAMSRELDKYSEKERLELASKIRESCSFHLLSPMAESYFFADGDALLTSGVRASDSPLLVHASDVEQFEANDPLWTPSCLSKNTQMQAHTPWWCHERHAKEYLEHLANRSGAVYDETRQGNRALSTLRWENIPKHQTDTPLIRSLFEDLSSWFDVPNPLRAGQTHDSLFPPKSKKPEERMLRNF